MTAKETAILEQLRNELHSYHVEVTEHIVRCEGCRTEVTKLSVDLYGLPGNKDTSPGLMGDVASAKQSLRAIRTGLRYVWAVILVALGAAATAATSAVAR